jgi:hypothetical protein
LAQGEKVQRVTRDAERGFCMILLLFKKTGAALPKHFFTTAPETAKSE